MPNLSGVKWGIVSESDMYNQADIKNALASGPVSAQFMVYQDFVDFFNNPANRYSAYHENGTRLHGVGHAVVIVGYDDATSSWLCKNSWGSAWADGGYFRIGYGDGTGIDESESSEVTVNSSCFAKIVPNIIGSLGTATGYAFGTNEWAYAINNASSGGNVSIPTGKVLTINPGKTITFSNGDLLTVNGTLQAVGTSSQPITFDRSGTSGSWGGITFNSGSSGSLSYCTIQHATTAVTATGMLPSIQNCTISYNTNGIWVSGAGNSTAPLSYNTIQNNTGYGIYLNQSSPRYVHHNNISYNHNASNTAVGIYCYSASAPYLSYDVLTNNDIALSCANSPAWLITYATPPGQDVIKSNLGGILAVTSNVFLNYSNSSIYQNTNYAISEQFYSTVSAQYNYWHRETYPNCVLASDFLTYRGGSITYTPALCTDPNPMGKIAVGGSIAESPVLSSETTGSNSSTGPGFFDSELLAALDAMVLHNYEKAIAIYLPRFKKETDSAKRIYVLQQLAECYRAAEKADFSSLLATDIRPGLVKGDSLYTLSVDLEAMSLMAQKRYDDAAACWKALVDSLGAPAYIRKHALFDLGYLALVYKNDQTAAIPYFDRLKSSYPGDELTRQSGFLLDRASASASGPPEPLAKDDSPRPEDFTLDNCFPNPFNPTTTIRFGFPRDAHVKLVVYDILGREVAHLVEGFQQAGYHGVIWNAQNAASGMYFARLTVTNELGKVAYTVTNKLLLTK